MSDITREEWEALRAQFAALTARLSALETGNNRGGDAAEVYSKSLHDHLRGLMTERASRFAFAVVNIVAQSTGGAGSAGTAFSVVTIDKPDELPTDEKLAENAARATALLADPLTLRCLRTLLSRRFAGEPARATTAELANSLGATAEQIEAAMCPLVEGQVVQRGLLADNTVFYHWDGNNHLAMYMLCRA